MTTYNEEYLRSLIYLIIPGLVFAFLTLIFTCCFFCCWATGRVLDRRYAPVSKGKFFAYNVCVWILLVIGVIFAFTGNAQANNSITDLTDSVVFYLDNTTTACATGVAQLQQLNADPSVIADFTQLQNALNSAYDQAQSVQDNVNYGEDWRFYSYNIWTALTIIVLILGIFGAIAQIPCCACTMMLLACLTATGCWLYFGLHIPVYRLADDACDTANGILKDGDPPPSNLDNPEFASCMQNGTYGNSFLALYSDLSNQLQDLADSAIDNGMQGIDNNVPPPTGDDEQSILALANYTDALLTNISQQIEQVPPPQQQQLQQEVIFVSNYTDVAVDLALVVSCTVLKETATTAVDNFCRDSPGALGLMLTSNALLGLLLLPAGYLLLTGYKRLNAQEHLMWEGRRSSLQAPFDLTR